MASSSEEKIKREPSSSHLVGSEQFTTTSISIKQEFSVTENQEDETFEQFYSEV